MGIEKKMITSSRRATADDKSPSRAELGEGRIRRKKFATENRASSMPLPEIADASDADDAAFEERPKPRKAAAGGGSKNLSSSLVAHGASAARAAKSYEERVRRKLGMEGSSRRPSPDRLAASTSSAPPDSEPEHGMGDEGVPSALLATDPSSNSVRMPSALLMSDSMRVPSALLRNSMRPAREDRDLERSVGDRSKLCAILSNSLIREDSDWLSQDESDQEKGVRTASMTSIDANAAFEERLKRKLFQDGSDQERGGRAASMTSIDADAAFEERLRRKMAAGRSGENLSSSLTAHGVSAAKAAESYEERVMRKLGRESLSQRSLSNHLPISMPASSMPPDFDRSLDDKSQSSARSSSSRGSSGTGNAPKAMETHKEKIRRKLGRESSSRTKNQPTQHSSSMTAPRHNDIMGGSKSNLSSSLRIASNSNNRSEESHEEKVRRKLGQQLGTESKRGNNRPFHHSSSMGAIGEEEKEEAERSGSRRPNDFSASMPSNLEASVKENSLFGVEVVCFDELFRELQTYKRENGNSLAISVSHPSFLKILEALTSIGMEGLLTKIWDYQFAGVKAFKREHGDCLIPPTHPTLGKWAETQSEHYGRYEERMPGPMTKKRFKKLKDVGFDEFVRMKQKGMENDKAKESGDGETPGNRPPPDQKRPAEKLANAEAAESNSDDLTFEQKLKMTSNHRKFVDRGSKARKSSRKSGRKNKATVAAELEERRIAELQQKRIAQRNLRRGMSRRMSRKLSQNAMAKSIRSLREEMGSDIDDDNDDGNDNDVSKNGTQRSSSASNLCPGSWECPNCSHLNEPVGLNSCDMCQICDALKEEEDPSESVGGGRRGLLVLGQKTRDDIDVGGGIELDGLEDLPVIRRSSSSSNLCPGSWECPSCTYINEPVGLNAGNTCQVCNEPKHEEGGIIRSGGRGRRESLMLGEVFAPPTSSNAKRTRDDVDAGGRSELDDVLAVAASIATRPIPTEDLMDSRGNLDSDLAMAVARSIRHSIEHDEECALKLAAEYAGERRSIADDADEGCALELALTESVRSRG